MNTKTGELFDDYDSIVGDLKRVSDLAMEEINDMIIPISQKEHKYLKAMDRNQRKQWARDNRYKNKGKQPK